MAEKYKLSNNESHQLTMEAIIHAFEILSEKKGVSEISVTELCQKAGVSRAGFYLNYKSVEDVMHKVSLIKGVSLTIVSNSLNWNTDWSTYCTGSLDNLISISIIRSIKFSIQPIHSSTIDWNISLPSR